MFEEAVAPHVAALLREVAAKEGLRPNYETVPTRSQDVSLGGFHGVVKAVELYDGRRRVRLIVKTAPTDKLTRDLQQARKKFLNEILFYERLAGTLSRYGRPPRVPKYYGSSAEEGRETVVLEDLRHEGFAVKPCREGLDGQHMELVAAALAALHGAASEWRASDRRDFHRETTALQETFFLERDDPAAQKLAVLLFEEACGEGLNSLTPAVKAQLEGFVRRRMVGELNALPGWVTPPTDDATLLHGDPWCHNFLFKHNSKGEPTEVALIDWQMTRTGSPCLDLAECVLSSADLDGLASPHAFVRAYDEAMNGKSERSAAGFARWGRAGLLLALCIVVNSADRSDAALQEKFEETLSVGKATRVTDQATRARLAAIMQAAATLGVFKLD